MSIVNVFLYGIALWYCTTAFHNLVFLYFFFVFAALYVYCAHSCGFRVLVVCSHGV